MIGKIFFNNKWKLCRLEGDRLEILCAECEMPWRLQDKIFNPVDFAVAEFEDGYFYFFDLSNGLTKIADGYVQFGLKVQSFFKLFDPSSAGDFNLERFESITFKNGVLMPMVTLSAIPKFDIKIDELTVQIEFRLNEAADDFLCLTSVGTMLSNYPTKKMDYELVASLSCAVDFSMLNKIAKKLYKIIQFINADFNAPIESMIVKTNIGDLVYSQNDIYLTSNPIIKRYNYVNNCKENIREIAQNLVEDTSDVSFLLLLDKDNLIDNDYWLLGQSLETNVPDNIDGELQTTELTKEINVYEKLREEIQTTIEKFEMENEKIGDDRKSFILSLIGIAKFRRKAEFVFEKYNDFAKHYSKYKQFDSATLNAYSKSLQLARNTVHGSQRKIDDKDKIRAATELCIVGLYIYILEKSGTSPACIFNFIQCFYS